MTFTNEQHKYYDVIENFIKKYGYDGEVYKITNHNPTTKTCTVYKFEDGKIKYTYANNETISTHYVKNDDSNCVWTIKYKCFVDNIAIKKYYNITTNKQKKNTNISIIGTIQNILSF